MLERDRNNRDSLKQWMNKLLPIGTQVIDQIGMDYFVTGWYAANNQVHVKLTHAAGMDEVARDVPFDEVICWARFLPERKGEPHFMPSSLNDSSQTELAA